MVTSSLFSAYGIPLEMVTSFRYLGRLMLAADDDFLVVVLNIAKARALRRRMKNILSR